MFLQINNYLLLALLLLTLYFDLMQKKTPSFLTFPFMLWGLVANTSICGGEGFLFGLYGLLLGLALFFIPLMSGGMESSDVKLMGAIGALQGAQFVFQVALFTIFCWGALAFGYLLVNKQLGNTLKKTLGPVAAPIFNTLYFRYGYLFLNRLSFYFYYCRGNTPGKKVYMPYGVAIVLGTLLVFSSIGKQIFSLAGLF